MMFYTGSQDQVIFTFNQGTGQLVKTVSCAVYIETGINIRISIEELQDGITGFIVNVS